MIKKFTKLKKNILQKNNRKDILKYSIMLLVVLATLYIFMKFTLLITYDGSKYYDYLKYFKGTRDIGQWDTIRGFSFPLIIFLITSIFGSSIKGIVFGFYLFYIGLLYLGYKIISKLIKDNKLERKQFTIWIIYLLLFVLNPLIIGYGHTLLTEAVTPFFYFLMIYLCLKWNDINFFDKKKKFIIISILIDLIAVFVWFIKQPYTPTIWIIIFITSILSSIYNKNKKIFIQKFIVFLICIISTFISIKIWNTYLQSHNKDGNEKISNSFILANNMGGYSYHYKKVGRDIYCDDKYVKSIKMSKDEKKLLEEKIKKDNNWCDHVIMFDVTNIKGNVIEQQAIIQEKDYISLKESLNFLLKTYTKHPELVLHSYFENYLAIIDLEKVSADYVPTGIIEANAENENEAIGYIVFHQGYKNTWWSWQDYKDIPQESRVLFEDMHHLESTTNTNSVLSSFMEILKDGSNLSFKALLLICFPIFIYGFIMFLIHKNNLTYYVITLLSGSSFVHIMFHVFAGAIIDRYSYPIYPLMLLCFVLMLMDKRKESLKKQI